MPVCRFYQQGNCRYGNSCRFEHPGAGNDRNQSSNRFGALGGGSNNSNQSALDKYAISAETIERDLTLETPLWILSCYAPGRNAPEQLFGGMPREQSFEEMRLHFMQGKAAGQEQRALDEAQALYRQAKEQIDTAVRDVKGAANFIAQGEHRHPNREDICREGTQGSPFNEFLVGKRPKSLVPEATPANPFAPASTTNNTGSSPFGAPATQPTSTFGQPSAMQSAFGKPSAPTPANPFGQPSASGSAFGQPSQPTSAFGQPSALGAKPNPFGAPASSANAQGSTFGQPSQLGAQGGSAFGQPSQMGGAQGSAFGQPSQMGAQTGSAFGKPSQMGTQGSAFGQPSQLGQKVNPFASTSSATASPFAAAGNSTAPASNPFGSSQQPTQGASSSPFGAFANKNDTNNNPSQSPFGQATTQSSSPFAQQNGQSQPSAAAVNPFSASNQKPTPDDQNPFMRSLQPQNSPFSAQSGGSNDMNAKTDSPFAQKSESPFGAPTNAAETAKPNPFAPTAASTTNSAGIAAANANPYPPDSKKEHPPLQSYASKGMDGRLSQFKGKPVTYKDGKPGIRAFDGTWRRIWFPDGPPAYNKDTALPADAYDDKCRAQWAAFERSGGGMAFEDGVMPALPPPREVTVWDF